jgi:hypothetical protein
MSAPFTIRDAYDALFRAGLASRPRDLTLANGSKTLRFDVPGLVFDGDQAVGGIHIRPDKASFEALARIYADKYRGRLDRHLERNSARRVIVVVAANGPIPDDVALAFASSVSLMSHYARAS